ncbi:uncharacterized protein LOC134689998 [Mytilus trossulus]|uniref:uncharacterized protein LOC134689998 n=1 Tax=Mytilus trossulus TaxID=6551 RepID=UPI003003B142
MENLFEAEMTQMLSGSLAEGLDLPGSDADIMHFFNNVDVVQDLQSIKHPTQHTTLLMELDNDHPGFTRLKLISDDKKIDKLIISRCYESTTDGEYLSVKKFLNKLNKKLAYDNMHLSTHGPCFSDTHQTMDSGFCLRSKNLPHNAHPWSTRPRHQWPPNFVIDKIKEHGCLLVPKSPRTISDSHLLWRLSFSMTEKELVHSFNYTQLLCYGLLKLTLKQIINTNDDVNDLLCSYFLKTALFWVSEEVDIEILHLLRLFDCFFLCLDKLILWTHNCFCPNYFIPEENMFLGKIDKSNNKTLQGVLENIKCGGINGLINNLFRTDVLSTKREHSFSILDFFLYKISGSVNSATSISRCLELLRFAERLQILESSRFIIDSCRYFYGTISQSAAQCKQPLSTIRNTSNLHKRCYRHLKDGIRTDAVSGWLLCASFYYVMGHYNVTLMITEYAISRCRQDGMVYAGRIIDDDETIKSYRQIVHSKIKFNDRIKLATVVSVRYLRNSLLIPEELQLEVENEFIQIPPVVLSFCLTFLSYHHLGQIDNRQQALNDLLKTIKEKCFFAFYELSDSITILGVCYEISGDKRNAYECYTMALQCEGCVCRSAEARKLELDRTLNK